MADLNPKWVKGKTVAKVELNPFMDSGKVRHNPVIWFTDGSHMTFTVEELHELNSDGYGISVQYWKGGSR